MAILNLPPMQSKREEWDGLFVDIGTSDVIVNRSVIQADIEIPEPEVPAVCVCACVCCACAVRERVCVCVHVRVHVCVCAYV